MYLLLTFELALVFVEQKIDSDLFKCQQPGHTVVTICVICDYKC